MSPEPTRRDLMLKAGLLLNGVMGVIIGLPIVRYLLSPAAKAAGYRSWLPLGSLTQFPAGETRFATYRNPVSRAVDGDTAEVACWVRNVDNSNFQVFAVNCAHLGCPVRWFPQSGLFLCPCHGGAYYEDGSRASGPPERGLFEYEHKVENGLLMIQAGTLPTPGQPLAQNGGRPCCAG